MGFFSFPQLHFAVSTADSRGEKKKMCKQIVGRDASCTLPTHTLARSLSSSCSWLWALHHGEKQEAYSHPRGWQCPDPRASYIASFAWAKQKKTSTNRVSKESLGKKTWWTNFMKKSKFTQLRGTMVEWFCSQVNGGWVLKVDRYSAESTCYGWVCNKSCAKVLW